MKKYLLILSSVLAFTASKAQLTITDSLTLAQITTLLEGTGVTVSSLTVNCPATSLAEFSGTSEMAITHGIALSTGFADSMGDANVNPSTSGMFGTPGDPDLDALSMAQTWDACVLEFDCVPTGDTLLFNFSFGSEEYPEFVGSSFNDVFAILLSGPGISGTINAAALPGGTPVAINNVNASMNPTYYYDNEFPAGMYVSFDGFTNNLTAFAEVIPSSTYHFKVAIADASDAAYDSGVFLEAFSFRSVSAMTTGVNELSENVFNVFPNPSNGEFSINDKDGKFLGSELRIVNMLGQEVYKEMITAKEIHFDLGVLPAGVYQAGIYTGNKIYQARLQKK